MYRKVWNISAAAAAAELSKITLQTFLSPPLQWSQSAAAKSTRFAAAEKASLFHQQCSRVATFVATNFDLVVGVPRRHPVNFQGIFDRFQDPFSSTGRISTGGHEVHLKESPAGVQTEILYFPPTAKRPATLFFELLSTRRRRPW